MEKFERELKSYGIELAIDAAYEDTRIEHMGTDAIAQFYVRIEMWHEEQASVETLLLDHTQQAVQGAQEDERRLVYHMASPVLARRVVPSSIQELESTSYFVVPSFREVASLKVGKVHEVDIVHFGKQTETGTIAQGADLVELDLMLNIEFHTFVLIVTTEYALQSALVVEDECRHTGTDIHLTVSIHIIIHTRGPLDA